LGGRFAVCDSLEEFVLNSVRAQKDVFGEREARKVRKALERTTNPKTINLRPHYKDFVPLASFAFTNTLQKEKGLFTFRADKTA